MNDNIKTFYVAIKGNAVFAFGSNLTDFYRMFSNVYPQARNYQYYYREFKKLDRFTIDEVTFQKVV